MELKSLSVYSVFGGEKALTRSAEVASKFSCAEEDYNKNCKKLVKNVENKSKSCKNINNLQILKNFTIANWVEVVLSVEPYIDNMYEFVDGLVYKLAMNAGKYKLSINNPLRYYEETISTIERKKELINLKHVATTLLGLICSKEEENVVACTILKTKKISEFYVKGHYKPAYVKKNRYLNRVSAFCSKNGWDVDFFLRHFSSEPLVIYSVKEFIPLA